MKIYLILILALFVTKFNKPEPDNSSTITPSDFSTELPKGMYIWDSKTKNIWNDSIQILNDTLVVFKDPGFGYGRVFTFTYHYNRVEKEKLVLRALSMIPEGVYVYPEQYELHKDTFQIRFSDTGITRLLGPYMDEYFLKTTKPELQ